MKKRRQRERQLTESEILGQKVLESLKGTRNEEACRKLLNELTEAIKEHERKSR